MTRPHSIKPWIGICLIIATIGVTAYFMMFRGPAELASEAEAIANRGADNAMDKVERAGGWLKSAGESLGFTPTVIVANEVIHEGTTSINELATAEKTFKQKFSWEHTYLGSTKKIEVQAVFTAKAGYKLDQLPELEMNEAGDQVVARLPDPEILSLEQEKFRILDDKNGMWNRLSKHDREHAQNELKRLANESARESDLISKADENLLDHLDQSINNASDQNITIKRESFSEPPLIHQD